MNVAVTVNNNYVYPLSVMLESLYDTNRKEKIVVYLLYSDVSEKNIKRLQRKCRKKGGEFIPILLQEDCFQDAPLPLYFSKEMYYRILLAKFLPENVDRILYLDPDLVVLKDISSFYHMDMKNAFYAAVRDRYLDSLKCQEKNDSNYIYVNSGVLLCNITLLRAEQNVEKVFRFVEKNKEHLKFPDQDIINELYKNRIRYVEDSFNFNPNNMYFTEYVRYTFLFDMYRKQKQPFILHFMGEKKPWNEDYRGQFYYLYWKYERRLRLRSSAVLNLRLIRSIWWQLSQVDYWRKVFLKKWNQKVEKVKKNFRKK